MKFPMAYSGVKKLIAGEVLNIISAVFLFLTAVFAIFVRDDFTPENDPAGFFSLLALYLISTVFVVISFVLKLVGFNQARKDDKMFKKAIYFIIICAVSTIGLSLTAGMFNRICAGVDEVSILLVNVYTIMGIFGIALKLEDTAMQKRGKVTLFITTALFAVAFVLQFVMAFFPEIAETLGVVVAVIEFAGYTVCLIYLLIARKMLADAK